MATFLLRFLEASVPRFSERPGFVDDEGPRDCCLSTAVIDPVVDRGGYRGAVRAREIRELLMRKPMVELDPSPIIRSETVGKIQEDIRDSGLGRKTRRQ